MLQSNDCANLILESLLVSAAEAFSTKPSQLLT
jgi:hypothetical protein